MCLSLYMTSTVLPSNSSTNAYMSNSVLCRYSTYLCPLEASCSALEASCSPFQLMFITKYGFRVVNFTSVHSFHCISCTVLQSCFDFWVCK